MGTKRPVITIVGNPGYLEMPVSRAKTAYGLLAEIRQLILEEPKRYSQTDWLEIRNKDDPNDDNYFPSCGTVGCVAGWVCALKRKRLPSVYTIANTAANILGLSDSAQGELFDGYAAVGAPQTLRHAKSGAAHIARFMKKYAKQLKAKRV